MINEKYGLWVCVPSYNRPHKVASMNEKLGAENFTWYLRNQEQVDMYKAAGAVHTKITNKIPGSLVQKRNEMLLDAWMQNLWSMQISDDLISTDLVVADPNSTKGKRAKVGMGLREVAVPFWEGIDYMMNMWKNTPGMDRYKLGGTIPVCNLYFHHGSVRTDLFIIGDMIIVKPCSVFFDEKFLLKSDYDYTMQHLEEYGGAFRCEDVFFRFAHYGNKGGQVGVRDDQKMIDANTMLYSKWGKHIIPHPKRENEILLKWKPRREKGDINAREYHRQLEKNIVKPRVSHGNSTTDNNKIRELKKKLSNEMQIVQMCIKVANERYRNIEMMRSALKFIMKHNYSDPTVKLIGDLTPEQIEEIQNSVVPYDLDAAKKKIADGEAIEFISSVPYIFEKPATEDGEPDKSEESSDTDNENLTPDTDNEDEEETQDSEDVIDESEISPEEEEANFEGEIDTEDDDEVKEEEVKEEESKE